jgi:hypothetical protein
MSGHAELTDEKGIEGRIECGGHLRGNRNTATRKSQDDDVGTIPILAQVGCELLTGVGTIAERDRHRTLRESAAAVDDADARTAWRRDCIVENACRFGARERVRVGKARPQLATAPSVVLD